MTPFLTGQSLLTYLDIKCPHGTEFSASVCPNLKELRGNTWSLIALLPGRSITTVDCTASHLNLDQEIAAGVSRLVRVANSQLREIRTLTMRGTSWIYYQRMADQLPSVETLMTWSLSITRVSISHLSNSQRLLNNYLLTAHEHSQWQLHPTETLYFHLSAKNISRQVSIIGPLSILKLPSSGDR
jgi:hypothetical protein